MIVALGLTMVFVGVVRARNEVKNTRSASDVQLKRRYDLIETVKGEACAGARDLPIPHRHDSKGSPFLIFLGFCPLRWSLGALIRFCFAVLVGNSVLPGHAIRGADPRQWPQWHEWLCRVQYPLKS